ncbi:LuxR family two component transcriptional regulator [Kribbella voronezhensis]|uniref:LuxR family two component transcriptional regulator n=1 Tax=Kribbella voronezhensis TaxID=2512212 RepID=A0A4R7TAI3_9ACTN|nr:response regulator transcription factor [Kribbella voronezhensis]TDU88247.1 LuxR family two component transcriptional regulator [Kribbella voronezhensis]
MIRLVLADDEHLIRSGLRRILEAAPDLGVVAEAADGDEAVAAVRRHRPDVILLDVRMPRLDGLAAAARITAEPDPPKVVMLTTYDLDEYVHRALRVGAVGFLMKDTPPTELAAAVRVVHDGQAMLAPAVTRRLLDEFAERTDSAQARRRLTVVTDRELEVMKAVGRGLSNAEIGRELGMRETTVKAHVSRALAKLGLTNRVQAALLVRDARLG